MKGYFYRGRHRAPSVTGRRTAALAAATALPMFGATSTAYAAEAPDWGPIIACESGGDPRAQNPRSSASGLFQFIDSTWKRYGGETKRAKDASVDHQYEVANRAFAREGYRPWSSSKSCWAGRVGKNETPKVQKQRVSEASTKKTLSKPESDPVVVTKPVGSPTPGGKGGYTVRAGDTLSRIAAAHGTTWQVLHDKNRDVVEHPDWIWPGETLDV